MNDKLFDVGLLVLAGIVVALTVAADFDPGARRHVERARAKPPRSAVSNRRRAHLENSRADFLSEQRIFFFAAENFFIIYGHYDPL